MYFISLVHSYTREEIARLHCKAQNFANLKNSSGSRPNFYPCKIFYRTKPPAYFEDIKENHGNVMKPYVKDSNGDKRSPINGRIKGLFFSASVNWSTLAPMSSSPYGTRRLLVDTSALLSEYTKMYFADFYCRSAGPRDAHHVSLVFTQRSSKVDQFCEEHLKELDKIDNEFLRVLSPDEVQVTGSGIWVEILYTEDVNIGSLEAQGHARFESIPCSSVRSGAKRKKTGCSICSI